MGKIITLFSGDDTMKNIDIFDVSNYFINSSGEENPMTPLKLQKLCYYAQAWSLVWDDKELFSEDFQAWVHGPANYELYCKYRNYNFNNNNFKNYNDNIFNEDEKETLKAVLERNKSRFRSWFSIY